MFKFGRYFKLALPDFFVLCFLGSLATDDIDGFIKNFVVELDYIGEIVDALVEFKGLVQTDLTFTVLPLLQSVCLLFLYPQNPPQNLTSPCSLSGNVVEIGDAFLF